MGNLMCLETEYIYGSHDFYNGYVHDRNGIRLGERDKYKPVDMTAAYGANNHGSIEQINGQWYIFYHRHTNGTWYSRQGCAEKIEVLEDGGIPQVEMTSCGL